MKYALIGCGRIAPNHIKAAIQNGFDIVAICDIDEERFDILFERAGLSEEQRKGIAKYQDYNEMLDMEKPELVSIALPSGLHFEAARAVIERNINVIIEKPIAMSLDDAAKIIELSEKHNVTTAVCHQNRFNKAVQEMRCALEQGRFGTLSNAAITIRWSRNADYYADADWRGKWDSDGGTLMNQCIHGIDLLCWMCGNEIKRVYGATRRVLHPMIEAEDVGTAVVEFKNGVIATIEGTVNLPDKDFEEHLTLVGEKGVVKLGGTSANTIESWFFTDAPNEDRNGFHEKTLNIYGNGHTSLFKDVAEAITEGRKPYVDALAGYRALEVVLAIYSSSFSGQAVEFPLHGVASSDFNGRFD